MAQSSSQRVGCMGGPAQTTSAVPLSGTGHSAASMHPSEHQLPLLSAMHWS
jgi:hypothetical protein